MFENNVRSNEGMLTLFMSITGGIDWQIAYEPLREVSWVAQSLMNLYIVIGFFTILNVVTGVLLGWTAVTSTELSIFYRLCEACMALSLDRSKEKKVQTQLHERT